MKNTTKTTHLSPKLGPKMSQFLTSVDVRAYVRTFYNYCMLVFVVSENLASNSNNDIKL